MGCQIRHYELWKLRLPMGRDIGDCWLLYNAMSIVVLKLVDCDGRTGWGFGETIWGGRAARDPGWLEALPDLDTLRQQFEALYWPRLQNHAVEDMVNPTAPRLPTGVLDSAVCAALWDLYAVQFDSPLHAAINPQQPAIPIKVYGSALAYHASTERAVALHQQIAQSYGTRSLKVKVGRRDVMSEIDRLHRIQDAIGNDIEIAVDANEAWGATEAIRWVEELDRHNLSIAYLEDPLQRNDHGGLLDIKRHTGVKIAGHDYVTEPDHIESLLDTGALDYLRLPGTIDGALIWARLAKRYNIPLIAGNSLFELNVHLAVAFPNQTDRIEFADLAWNRLPVRSVTVRDGFMHAPQTPGHGLAPNLDMLGQLTDNNPTPTPENVASKA